MWSVYSIKNISKTEHWQNNEQINPQKLEYFEIIKSYCRCETIHGGATIFKKNCNPKIELLS